MQSETEPFIILNDLAVNCLSREEYAQFLTLMQNIRDRSSKVIEKNNEEKLEISKIKYPYDLECNLQCKIFKNNQKGERIELSEYLEIPLLIKVPIGEEPRTRIEQLYKKITE